ncbi:hypothetical protein DICVIV_06516 [Dictyocaulus viviparus]|uniref:DUF19 domain-containing protein n=1 Tax=Dictyocaulus viviparus TaxID=29172 RepID=A0A0D8XS95_DICVI|nr:hypothetical protein DICVIV_06516 [Dictyocaulus viviparus]
MTSSTEQSTEDDVNPNETASNASIQTTEIPVVTTTRPPYCIPYRDHRVISFCHKSIVAKLSALSAESPSAASIRFPLYNVSYDEVVALCDELSYARKCMDGVEKLCTHPDCTELINKTLDQQENKCEGHEGFLSCMKAELDEVCGIESYNSVVTVLKRYGCNISDDIVAANTSITTIISSQPLDNLTQTHRVSLLTAAVTTQTLPAIHAINRTAQDGSNDHSKKSQLAAEILKAGVTYQPRQTTAPSKEVKKSLESSMSPSSEGHKTSHEAPPVLSSSEKSDFVENEITSNIENIDPLFNYTISSNCTVSMRNKARSCTAPLMRTWIALRAVRPNLAQTTFPLYKYSRVELLELCDSYANVFQCANVDHLRACIMDELVRFAQDHLGYICSPQNIERFMKHYDCIMEQEVMGHGNCQRFIIGEAIPGKDQRKCHGVSAYRECLVPHLQKHCHPEAVNEFDASIRQFGCNVQHQHS